MALAGKVCVVTGASKGIGRGIALQLGSNGATVYITGRSEDKLKSCADEIKSRGGEVSDQFKEPSCHRRIKFELNFLK